MKINRLVTSYNPYSLPTGEELSNIFFHHNGEVLLTIGYGWLESYIPAKDMRENVPEIVLDGDAVLRRTVPSGLKQGGHFFVADPKNKHEGARWGRKYHLYIDMVPERLPDVATYRDEVKQYFVTPWRLPLTCRVNTYSVEEWRAEERDYLIVGGYYRSEVHEEGKEVLALKALLEAKDIKLDISDVAKLHRAFILTPR